MNLFKFWLSSKDVEELTGAKSRSKQMKVLDFMGYSYRIRPDGSFVVPVEQFQEPKRKEYTMDFASLG
tara:strand:- start:1353 stop:1556 length:204 start_codon:yes stop_codon:yes gene_type:complete